MAIKRNHWLNLTSPLFSFLIINIIKWKRRTVSQIRIGAIELDSFHNNATERSSPIRVKLSDLLYRILFSVSVARLIVTHVKNTSYIFTCHNNTKRITGKSLIVIINKIIR